MFVPLVPTNVDRTVPGCVDTAQSQIHSKHHWPQTFWLLLVKALTRGWSSHSSPEITIHITQKSSPSTICTHSFHSCNIHTPMTTENTSMVLFIYFMSLLTLSVTQNSPWKKIVRGQHQLNIHHNIQLLVFHWKTHSTASAMVSIGQAAVCFFFWYIAFCHSVMSPVLIYIIST